MIKTFNCPSCGAPLDYDGGDDSTIRCPFCSSSVIVPTELRTGAVGTPRLERDEPSFTADPLSNTLGHLKEFGEIASLVKAGRKIDAVKLYREITGAGLKEAKDAVEMIAAGRMIDVSNFTFNLGQPSPTASNLAGTIQEIQQLIRAGNKIEAIKRYREVTGLGLKESKDVIDRLAEGKGIQVSSLTIQVGQPGLSDPIDKMAEVNRFLRAGNKIEAIKLYRETTGLGLKESKDEVEKLEAAMRASSRMTASSPMAASIGAAANFEPAGASSGGCGRIALFVIISLIIIASVAGAGLWILASANSGDNQIASLLNDFVSTETASPAPPTQELPHTPMPSPTQVPSPTPTPEFAGPALSFGEEGAGPGQFSDARAISLDGAGNIYIGEYGGERMQVFDAEGEFVRQWKFEGKPAFLSGLAVDNEGIVYAVLNGNIERYDGATGEALGKINYANGQGFQSVAVTAGGLVASWNKDWAGGLFTNFSESQDDIVIFGGEGKVTTVIAQALSVAAGGSPELDTTVAVGEDGTIYAVGDLNGNAVFKFSSEGKFLDRFSLDEASTINAFALDSQSHLYVPGSRGILVYDSEGRYLDAFAADTSVRGLAVGVKDELFAITNNKQVIKYVLNDR